MYAEIELYLFLKWAFYFIKTNKQWWKFKRVNKQITYEYDCQIYND